ncbi:MULTISPECIES: hypothetical protein [Pseudomonadota]|mgnify:FL=1|jgi:hypothetical protein|uniref:hypothetical protein n=1 Tax=Pseudomonadota TaxID=1224 RepID=UPI000E0D5528|nr:MULTISPECIES: hypothetical protein [Pseudomonadota]DAO77196.1 MAG TPA: zinc-ribbon domain protein [Caudoviricetes sp.]
MKVRCPTCGAVMSLDVLIAHDDAREALIALTGISDDLFKAVLRYLTLFRPAEKDLSFNRVSKLLGELAPMIRAGEIVRNRKAYPAPREAWVWAVMRCLEARDAGKLTPPLTSHGFLLENITFWSPEKTAGTVVLPSPQPSPKGEGVSTKLRSGAGDLMEWANGGQG